MIEIVGLTKRTTEGKILLGGIRAELEPGTVVALAGPSGSGKSLLLKCLALREPWTSGEYRWNGENVLKESALKRWKIRRQIAYLEQKPVLLERQTALKNVIVGAVGQTPWWRRVTGMVRNDDYLGAMDVLEQLGLLDRAHYKAEKLSGGERQRVAIARAIVHGARLLLADEPVSGLDPHASEAVLAQLRQMCKERQIAAVLALYRWDWAEKYADEIWGLKDGRLELRVRGRRLTEAEKAKLS
jgi:phosphonate transport system ATP-binding protein